MSQSFHVRFLTMLVVPALLLLSTGADHRDAPGLLTDPAADINDVYAFVNPNTNNVVLAMTVNPFTAPGLNPTFGPHVLYQFKIDNTGDAVEDLVIQVTFDEPTGSPANPTQNFSVIGPVKPKKTGVFGEKLVLDKGAVALKGAIDNSGAGTFATDSSTGMKVFAGSRDDPFFFDFVYVIGFLNNNVPKRNPGIDFFAGFNVSIIAIELPAKMLTGSNGNKIAVWGTTSVPDIKRTIKAPKSSKKTTTSDLPTEDEKEAKVFVQKDRMGLPAINTVLISKELKNSFNFGSPSTDRATFLQTAVDHILPLDGNDTTHAQTVASALLPDMLTLDVTSTTGFDKLNGRRPQDDVIDVELNLLTNGKGPNSDGVNANDVPFLTDFPFFAPPHPAAQGVPPRN